MNWMNYRPIVEILVTYKYTNEHVRADSHPGEGQPWLDFPSSRERIPSAHYIPIRSCSHRQPPLRKARHRIRRHPRWGDHLPIRTRYAKTATLAGFVQICTSSTVWGRRIGRVNSLLRFYKQNNQILILLMRL